ncbi:MAG: hypothetical protein V1794_08310 [Candidatus Glassbacteria bacterium]
MSKSGRSYFSRIAVLTSISLTLAGCSKDAPTSLPADFSYEGTYIALGVQTTQDNDYVLSWDRNAVTGLMQIANGRYSLVLYFGSEAFGYGSRQDVGRIEVDQDAETIRFIPEADTTQTDPVGRFDLENDWLRVNYLKSDWLWTEVWKRADPVTQLPDSTGQLPY